jgi:hypothetical protein
MIENYGTIDYTGQFLYFGPPDWGIGQIRNVGNFNIIGEGDFSVWYAGAHTFDNEGSFTHSGSGTTLITSGLTFDNSGTVHIQGGTFADHK